MTTTTDEIILNDEQQIAFDRLKEFLDKGSETYFLLEGCAGSGKSTLTAKLIKHALENSLFGKIAIVAPTHKAVKVIKKMVSDEILNHLDFSSLHSLLGMKHRITNDGKEIFTRDPKSICKLSMYDVIIIDEASMIADDLFFELENQNYNGTKVVFVGDSNQINPVNHAHSIPMIQEKRELYNIQHLQLTKIVRQAENNPIIKFSQKVLKKDFSFEPGVKDMIDSSGVVMFSSSNKPVLTGLLKYYFCSEEFDKNPDYCKLIAWRNATVDSFNNIIRTMKYGRGSDKIVLGEKLIVDKPIKDNLSDKDEIMFNTNEDLIVTKISTRTKKIFEKEFMFYEAWVMGDEQESDIHIIHEKSQALYAKTLNDMANAAKTESDPIKRGSKWRNYYSFMENFAQVNYNYAITAHCSQGSTYENALVAYSDISLNRREDEQKRLVYTSFTRPKKMLYIF